MNKLSTNSTKQRGRHSTIRPPYFIGTHYNYWKTKVQIFVSSNGIAIWQIIIDGYQEPIISSSSWNEQEKKTYTINAKAMNALYCTLYEVDFNRVSLCQMAKNICDLLEATYEGA